MGLPSKFKLHSKTYQEQAINYKKHLDILGLNPKSSQSKYLLLNEFLWFLEANKIFDLQEITPKVIADYNDYLNTRKSLITGKALKHKSIYDHMRNLQQYLGHLLALGTIKTNPASHLKFTLIKEKTKRFIFSQEQIQMLYKAANLEEKILLNIGYGCGLRVQEISDLNKEDIRLIENIVIVQKGKNSKRRIVPISQKISDELSDYLKDKTSEVFTNSKGSRMQEWTLNKKLKQLLLKTDFGKKLTSEELNKIGIHSLRHSIATHLLQNGMKLEQVQKFLGHNHIESTEIYTHITQNQINSLYDNTS